MASRIRGDSQLFEVIVEAHRITSENGQSNTELRFVHPQVEQDVLKSVTKFVFPFHSSFISSSVDCFTFVLTDGDGTFKFGFCRLSTDSNVCHCLVSYYPWFSVFYGLLNHFVEMKKSCDLSLLTDWIDSILKTKQFSPGKRVKLESFQFAVPDLSQLMTIPASINLTEYYCAVDIRNMMEIFASTLLERRIIVTSKRLSRLTACIHSVSSFLYPFHWQHIFIPILPPHLLDFCSAPMPFLIGVHSSLWSMINKDDLGDVLILNADDNTIHSSFHDLNKLPQTVVAKLKKNLEKGKSICFGGDLIPRAFLRCIASIFGGYRMAFKTERGKIVFDGDAFIKTKPVAFESFMRTALQLQIFQQFIEERLILMNSGKQICDLFEEEIRSLDNHEKQRGKNVKLSDYKIIRFLKKADKSRFTSFLENFVGGCSPTLEASSSIIKAPKSQTPTLSKKFPHKFPRKMSENYVGDFNKESSRKLLASSNSSDGFPQHLEQTALKRMIEGIHLIDIGETLMDSQQLGDAKSSTDEINWQETLSPALSYETVMQGNLEVRSKMSHSLDDVTSDNVNNCGAKNVLSADPSSPRKRIKEDDIAAPLNDNKPLTADNSKGVTKKVQHLIKLYENKEVSNTSAKPGIVNQVYSGTYFPPHQAPSSIAARRAELQAATELWKRNYRSRNISDVQPQNTYSSEYKLPQQISHAASGGAKQSLSDNSLLLPQTGSPESNGVESCLRVKSIISEESDPVGKNQMFKRITSGIGLSRRSAFKANKSQSSSDSQKGSFYRKSIRESIDKIQKKDSEKPTPENNGDDSDSDALYSTPPPLPRSPPPLDEDVSRYLPKPDENKKRYLTLGASDVQCANRYPSDDNLSLDSTASSYSSFLSADFNDDSRHFTLPTRAVGGVYGPMPFQRGKSDDVD